MQADQAVPPPPETRSQAVKLALGGYNKIKTSRTGVIVLKGGLAIGQITALTTLLTLSHTSPSPSTPLHTQSSLPSSYCSKPLEEWIVISIVRLAVCWGVSLWVVSRRGRGAGEGEDDDEGDEGDEELEEGREGRDGVRERQASGEMLLRQEGNMSRGERERKEEEILGGWEKFARIADKVAPKISILLALLSMALFISGNYFLFSSLSTCKVANPLQWWAVMTVVGVGWFLLGEVVVVVLVVGIVGPQILKLLRSLKIIDPLPPPTLPFPLPPKPISPTQVNLIQKVVYLPLGPTPSLGGGGAESPVVSLPKSESEKSLPQSQLGVEETQATLQEGKAAGGLLGWRKIFGKTPSTSHEEGANPSPTIYLPTLASSTNTDTNSNEKPSTQSRIETKRYKPDFSDKRYHHPPVRLPPELASCTVCLMDFVEGKERSGGAGESGDGDGEEEEVLRLLRCGHAFHVNCIDHWLTTISGRCPVCNMPVGQVDPPPAEV